MKLAICCLILISFNAWGKISILNFNTMCDICKGSSLPKYHKRIASFKKIIGKYNPDLLSLQEFRVLSHLEKVLNVNKDYDYITYQGPILNYPDAVIAYKQSRFLLKNKGVRWLGPKNNGFTLGWKYSLPRLLVWAHLLDKQNGKEFIFIGTHLDNRLENLSGSAQYLQDFIATIDIPIIFAGDTNITFEMPEYKSLSKNFAHILNFRRSFTKIGKFNGPRDLCYLKKGKSFPDCLVEHILLSKKTRWSIYNYVIDLTRMDNSIDFPSDHRPFYVEVRMH